MISAKIMLVLIALGKTLGAIVMSMVGTLLAGKAIKRLFLFPFQWLASKTQTKKDDILIHDAEEDLGLE